MIPTHIVVPVLDRLDLTTSLIHQLWNQTGWDRLTVYDNGSAEPTRRYLASVAEADDRITIRRTPKMGIYDMWRDGFDQARKEHPGAVNVAILNNDITMAKGTIDHLSAALRSRFEMVLTYPDYDLPYTAAPEGPLHIRNTQGTYKNGGMSGWCFMLAADRVTWEPLVNPSFEWWCGDDDIAAQIDAAGGQQGRVEGLGLDHVSEATAATQAWTHEVKPLDLKRFGELWGS